MEVTYSLILVSNTVPLNIWKSVVNSTCVMVVILVEFLGFVSSLLSLFLKQ